MTKKEQKAAQVAANKYEAFVRKVRALAGWVSVPTGAIVVAYEGGVIAEDFAVSYVCKTAVGAAIWPLKVAAVEAATKHASETINIMVKKLEAAEWNLDVVAPRPRFNAANYRAANDLRSRYTGLFNTERARFDGPTIASRNEEYEQRYIAREQDSAAYQYNLFVLKLVNKIGNGAVSATLEGNHIWSHSVLSVTMTDGRVDCWKTQQIENRSKLGLWFPQWPSRLTKGGK